MFGADGGAGAVGPPVVDRDVDTGTGGDRQGDRVEPMGHGHGLAGLGRWHRVGVAAVGHTRACAEAFLAAVITAIGGSVGTGRSG